MTKFSSGERLQQRLSGRGPRRPRGDGRGCGTPTAASRGSLGPTRAERWKRRAPLPGGQRSRQRWGTARPRTAPGPLLDGRAGLYPPAPTWLLPLDPREATESRPPTALGLTPYCRAEHTETPRRGCSYPVPALKRLSPAGLI